MQVRRGNRCAISGQRSERKRVQGAGRERAQRSRVPQKPTHCDGAYGVGLNGPIGIAFSPSRSGDYTIHGAPWRSQFGFPQSNGCVSLDSRVAKQVYDWTPIGTPVNIHY